LLQELEKLFKSDPGCKAVVSSSVLKLIAELRKEVESEDGDIARPHKGVDHLLDELYFFYPVLQHTILWALVYARYEKDYDWQRPPASCSATLKRFEEEVLKQAKKYLDSPSIHTRWLTTYVLTQLLDSALLGISEEVVAEEEIRLTLRLARLLPKPWGRVVPPLLSLLFFVGSLVAMYYLLKARMGWLAGLLFLYLCWHYFQRFRTNFFIAKVRRKRAELETVLRLTRDEVASGCYDGEAISGRLQRLQDDLVLYSLIHPLLRLSGSPCGDPKRAKWQDMRGC
jgi:hypothetical protein